MLISFLNAILDFEEKHKIIDVTILNPYQLPKFRDGKATIIDVKAKDQSGREFIVEMQVADAGLRSAFEQANIQTWSQEEIDAYDYAGLRETEDRLRVEKAKSDAKKDREIEIAKQMKIKGMDVNTIAEITGLTADEIDEI